MLTPWWCLPPCYGCCQLSVGDSRRSVVTLLTGRLAVPRLSLSVFPLQFSSWCCTIFLLLGSYITWYKLAPFWWFVALPVSVLYPCLGILKPSDSAFGICYIRPRLKLLWVSWFLLVVPPCSRLWLSSESISSQKISQAATMMAGFSVERCRLAQSVYGEHFWNILRLGAAAAVLGFLFDPTDALVIGSSLSSGWVCLYGHGECLLFVLSPPVTRWCVAWNRLLLCLLLAAFVAGLYEVLFAPFSPLLVLILSYPFRTLLAGVLLSLTTYVSGLLLVPWCSCGLSLWALLFVCYYLLNAAYWVPLPHFVPFLVVQWDLSLLHLTVLIPLVG